MRLVSRRVPATQEFHELTNAVSAMSAVDEPRPAVEDGSRRGGDDGDSSYRARSARNSTPRLSAPRMSSTTASSGLLLESEQRSGRMVVVLPRVSTGGGPPILLRRSQSLAVEQQMRRSSGSRPGTPSEGFGGLLMMPTKSSLNRSSSRLSLQAAAMTSTSSNKPPSRHHHDEVEPADWAVKHAAAEPLVGYRRRSFSLAPGPGIPRLSVPTLLQAATDGDDRPEAAPARASSASRLRRVSADGEATPQPRRTASRTSFAGESLPEEAEAPGGGQGEMQRGPADARRRSVSAPRRRPSTPIFLPPAPVPAAAAESLFRRSISAPRRRPSVPGLLLAADSDIVAGVGPEILSRRRGGDSPFRRVPAAEHGREDAGRQRRTALSPGPPPAQQQPQQAQHQEQQLSDDTPRRSKSVPRLRPSHHDSLSALSGDDGRESPQHQPLLSGAARRMPPPRRVTADDGEASAVSGARSIVASIKQQEEEERRRGRDDTPPPRLAAYSAAAAAPSSGGVSTADSGGASSTLLRSKSLSRLPATGDDAQQAPPPSLPTGSSAAAGVEAVSLLRRYGRADRREQSGVDPPPRTRRLSELGGGAVTLAAVSGEDQQSDGGPISPTTMGDKYGRSRAAAPPGRQPSSRVSSGPRRLIRSSGGGGGGADREDAKSKRSAKEDTPGDVTAAEAGGGGRRVSSHKLLVAQQQPALRTISGTLRGVLAAPLQQVTRGALIGRAAAASTKPIYSPRAAAILAYAAPTIPPGEAGGAAAAAADPQQPRPTPRLSTRQGAAHKDSRSGGGAADEGETPRLVRRLSGASAAVMVAAVNPGSADGGSIVQANTTVDAPPVDEEGERLTVSALLLAFLFVSRAVPNRHLAEIERATAEHFHGKQHVNGTYSQYVDRFKVRIVCCLTLMPKLAASQRDPFWRRLGLFVLSRRNNTLLCVRLCFGVEGTTTPLCLHA